MAIEVVGWVFAHSRSKNAERLVMLAVADACNSPDGTGAWLSNAALMAKTNLSERAVQNATAGCERLGELKIERNAGRGGVNRYRVVMVIQNPAESAPFSVTPQNLHPAESAPFPDGAGDTDAQASGEKGADSAGQGPDGKGAESAPGTVRNSSKKSSSRKPPKKSEPSRGTRLPADFHATAEMIAWARENTPNVGAKETAAFIDYFRSAPGQKGVKVDWLAAWRGWMRREQKRIDEQAERDRKREERWANNGPGYNSRRDGSSPTRTIPRDRQCQNPAHRGKPIDQDGNCRQCQIDAALEKAEGTRT